MRLRLLVNGLPLLGPHSGVGKYAYQICRHLALATTGATTGAATGAAADATAEAAATTTFDTTYYYGYGRRRKLIVHTQAAQTEQAPHGTGRAAALASVVQLLRRWQWLRQTVRHCLHMVDKLHTAQHDLYFEPNFILQDNLRAAHAVATIHDFSCFRYPQWHPADRVRHFEKHFWPSLQRADKIITVSEAIRQEAIQSYGLEASRLQVIHNGVDHAHYRPLPQQSVQGYRKALGLPQRFLLCVGTLEPRKNIENLLHAYAALPHAVKQACPLFLAGGKGWNNQQLLHTLHTNRQHVHRLGYVPEEALPLLYNAATLSVYPSWYEGFGLPALEAMACGCPVLTTDGGALREVCADAAAYFEDVADVPGMSRTLHTFLEDATALHNFARQGLARASHFCWQQSAQAHGELFHQVCAK